MTFKPRPCAVCGATFTPTAPQQRYCSAACREKARAERKREERSKPRRAAITRTFFRGRNPGGFSSASSVSFNPVAAK